MMAPDIPRQGVELDTNRSRLTGVSISPELPASGGTIADCLGDLAAPRPHRLLDSLRAGMREIRDDTRGSANYSFVDRILGATASAMVQSVLFLRGAKLFGEGIIIEHTTRRDVRAIHLTPPRGSVSTQSHDQAVRKTLANVRLAPNDLDQLLRITEQASLRGRTPSEGAVGVFALAVTEFLRHQGLKLESGARRKILRAADAKNGEPLRLQAGAVEISIRPHTPSKFEALSYRIGELLGFFPKAGTWREVSYGKAPETQRSTLRAFDLSYVKPWLFCHTPALLHVGLAFGTYSLHKITPLVPNLLPTLAPYTTHCFSISAALLGIKLLSHLPIGDELLRQLHSLSRNLGTKDTRG